MMMHGLKNFKCLTALCGNNGSYCSQDFSHSFWKLKLCYLVWNILTIVPILIQSNSLHGFLSYLLKYILILSSHLGLNLPGDLVHPRFIIICLLDIPFPPMLAIYRYHLVVLKGGFTHSMPCPCRSPAMPCR
jgi:hypothetical protein